VLLYCLYVRNIIMVVVDRVTVQCDVRNIVMVVVDRVTVLCV
jgi:hypothetical protein